LLRIGITGGSGAGKTTLLRELERRGAVLFDCDEIYHQLLEENKQMLAEIAEKFPEAFAGGEFERKELGKIVFSDPERLEILNKITHRFVDEYVDREAEEAARRGVKTAAVDAIALFESGMAAKCDVTIAVLAEPETRAKRLVAREGISYEYAILRIKAQQPDSFFEQRCDYVLHNDGGKEQFRADCIRLIDKIMEMRSVSIYEEMESEVRSYSRSFPTVFTRAKMSKVSDENGKVYIDFFAGAGALNYGHNNEYIKAKIIDYLENDGIIHSLDMFTSAKTNFLETFRDKILIPRGMDYKVMFCGPTGTNAVEAALKLCRKIKKRDNIFAFMGAFHGMTLGSLALTSNRESREGAGTRLDGVTFVPYPGVFGDDFDTLAYIEKLITDDHSGVQKPAAIFLESVQAEGGVNVPSAEWLRGLRALCDKYDIFMVCDDIQVGCGRTGPFFSFERAGIKPDAVVLSKSISGYGMPMAILLFRPEMDIWKPAEHNGTFRGFQLAFVGAAAALEYREKAQLEKTTPEKGKIVESFVKERILPLCPGLKHRGIGLLHGIDCTDAPVELLAKKTSAECFKNGLIIERAGRGDHVLKIAPPLVIKDDELLRGLEIIEYSMKKVLEG